MGTAYPVHYSEEAERSVIGAILLAGSLDAIDGALDSSHFYNAGYAQIFRFLRAMKDEGQPADAVLLQERLKLARNGLSLLGLATQCAMCVPDASRLVHYANLVRSHARAREALACFDALRSALSEPANALRVDEVLRDGLRWLDENRAETPAQDLVAPSIADLMAKNLPERQWIVEGWLQRARTMILFGPSYSGKSLLSTQIGLAVAAGQGDVCRHAVPGPAIPVLLLLGENDEVDLRDAIRPQLDGGGPPTNFRYLDALAGPARRPLCDAAGMAWLRAAAVANRAELLILDNLMSLVGGDLCDAETAVFVMEGFKRLEKELGIAILALAHPRKEGPKGDDASIADRLYGAQEWRSYADSIAYVGFVKGEEENGKRTLYTPKLRGGRPDPPCLIELDEDTYTAHWVAELSDRPKQGRPPSITLERLLAGLAHLCATGRPAAVADLAANLGNSERRVRKALSADILDALAAAGFAVYERSRKGAPNAFSRANRT